MMTRLLPLVLLVAAAACKSRNVPAEPAPFVEGTTPLAVHPDLEDDLHYVQHTVGRTPDGRMTLKLILASDRKTAMTLVAFTIWFDENGLEIERSKERTIVLPAGSTYAYEDVSYSPKAARFNVSIRPANTSRKK